MYLIVFNYFRLKFFALTPIARYRLQYLVKEVYSKNLLINFILRNCEKIKYPDTKNINTAVQLIMYDNIICITLPSGSLSIFIAAATTGINEYKYIIGIIKLCAVCIDFLGQIPMHLIQLSQVYFQ